MFSPLWVKTGPEMDENVLEISKWAFAVDLMDDGTWLYARIRPQQGDPTPGFG